MIVNRFRKIMDRGLLGMMPNTYVSPFAPPLHSLYQKLAVFDQHTFGTWSLPDGTVTPLYNRYRDFVKRVWRLDFPALNYLYNLALDYSLPEDTQQLLAQMRQSPTLTVSEAELNQHVEAAASLYPEVTQTIILADGTTSHQYISPDQIAPIVQSYRDAARILETRLRRASGLTLKGLRTLEIGTGTGLNCYAVAERGAVASTGIDIDYAEEGVVFRKDAITSFSSKNADLASKVELLQMNANQTTFGDAAFDLIYSTSVLEHVQDLHLTFKEMYRLLRPGGWAVHSVGPYWSPAGGHALVTLDFPWGHARLTDTEIHTYLRQLRPHEADKASRFLTQGLTQPHHVLTDYARFALEAGFELVCWQENVLDNHRALLNRDILAQTQALNPRVTLNDLLTNELILVLHKNAA